MDYKQIQDLIRFVSKSGVCEVKIEQGDFKITIKTKGSEVVQVTPVIAQPVAAVAAPVETEQKITNKPPVPTYVPENPNLITIKSPMIGTFYRSPGPDKEVFVKVGDTISKGSVLCIIEAMKLFNEIESEFDGKIVKVLADDSTPVEYDQPLFLIEKV
jgi:acetyl-CoA carboxylase biotin carboxyl carrier protein